MRGRHFRLIQFFVAFVCLSWWGQLLINTFLPLCQWAPFRVHPTALICQLVSRMSVIRKTARNQARASVILRETIQLYSAVQSDVSWGRRLEWMTKLCLYECIYWNLTTDAGTNLQWGDLWFSPVIWSVRKNRLSWFIVLYVCLLYAVSQANIRLQKHSLSQWPRVKNWISCPWLTEQDQILCAAEMALLEWMTVSWISQRTCRMLSLLRLF